MEQWLVEHGPIATSVNYTKALQDYGGGMLMYQSNKIRIEESLLEQSASTTGMASIIRCWWWVMANSKEAMFLS